MTLHGLPVLFALFIWWFSTGLIIFLDNLPPRTFKWSVLGATVVLAASIFGLLATKNDTSVTGAYLAFTFAILAWGWHEITFYTGVVTGPRNQRCPEGCSGWAHLGHAIMASLYHEIAILASAAAVISMSWGAANQVGMWTFVVLWWMHQSAKLNVMLGVRNCNEQFVPSHLEFLRGFLRQKPMNLLFPVSITVSTIAAVFLFQRAFAADATRFDAAGYTFVGILMVLAIVEHWVLILPLPFAALWDWSLRARNVPRPLDVEVVAGFLGAGKTTYLRRVLMDRTAASGRTVVLVNDFGEIGVDGSLLAAHGAEVVELPNGCICCSLRGDLTRQITAMVARWAPERLLIEPSGVADVAALLAALEAPAMQPHIRRLSVRTIIDAGTFLRDFANMEAHFSAQVRLASSLLVNKTDLATPAQLRLITDTLRTFNPAGEILFAAYGVADPVRGAPVLAVVATPAAAPPVAASAGYQCAPANHEPVRDHGHDHGDVHAHGHQLAPGHDHIAALDLMSWSATLGGACDPDELQRLLESVARGNFGDVARVKGIARAGSGWIRFDLAGGRPSMAAFAAQDGEHPRVVAIGRAVDGVGLQAAFAACAAAAA